MSGINLKGVTLDFFFLLKYKIHSIESIRDLNLKLYFQHFTSIYVYEVIIMLWVRGGLGGFFLFTSSDETIFLMFDKILKFVILKYQNLVYYTGRLLNAKSCLI